MRVVKCRTCGGFIGYEQDDPIEPQHEDLRDCIREVVERVKALENWRHSD